MLVHYVRNSMLSTLLLFSAALPAQTLDQILARLDQNALTFKSMSANLRHLSHTAVINEDNVSTGTVKMKRSKRDVQILIEFAAPDPKAVALAGTKGEMYYPKMQRVEEYDLGKNRELVEKFLALG